MDLAALLTHTVLNRATVAAGTGALHAEVSWVHLVDHPDITGWIKPGHLLLTTGYHWPDSTDAQAQRALIRALHTAGLAGVVLAVPRFLDHFPVDAIDEANQVGLALLELPWDVPFSQVTEEVHARIIGNQHAMLVRSEAIHRALTNAAARQASLAELADVLSELLDRDVTFTAPDGALLGARDTSALRQSREKLYMLHSRDRFPQTPPATQQPLRIPAPQRDMPARLACPVYVAEQLTAVVWLDDHPTPLSDLDVRAAEHAAVVAAVQLGHMQALTMQEHRLGYSMLESMLEGSFKATAASLERVRLHGWDPDIDHIACLALFNEPLPLTRSGFLRREAWTARLRAYLEQRHHGALMFASTNQAIFLLSADADPAPLWQALAEKGMALAVSRAHRGVPGVRAAGHDVASLVEHLKPGQLLRFEHIMFPQALMGDVQARRMLIDSRLGPLLHDPRHAALLDTLRALAHTGFQLAQTAQELDIHISTLRYRLERLHALLGIDLSAPRMRFELQVALEMAAELEQDATIRASYPNATG